MAKVSEEQQRTPGVRDQRRVYGKTQLTSDVLFLAGSLCLSALLCLESPRFGIRFFLLSVLLGAMYRVIKYLATFRA